MANFLGEGETQSPKSSIRITKTVVEFFPKMLVGFMYNPDRIGLCNNPS